jgi:hypothetical protein
MNKAVFPADLSTIWWILLLIWPGWSFVLWNYSDKKISRVLVPMALGLIIMWRVFIWFLLPVIYSGMH